MPSPEYLGLLGCVHIIPDSHPMRKSESHAPDGGSVHT